ncbi:Crp/Fnr family transcriptional regulator [Melittangium boletus]|uniref:Crp/Fnr family transcriptional regulator n=1 Tax=Melittangium boletus DSM 14713 TaxID=1294270 RepID=A0A250ID22_9BACT|nr:Crp/Fnr family transcriptional regulator [Melittangium boletus]ATB29061.1 Crp/Fnr family transcriptional regulator [Melittangium boletus DSM 14713]
MKPDRTALDYLELFRTGSWFRAMPAGLQEKLLRAGVLRTLKTGQHLFSRGDPPGGIHGMVDGAIQLRSVGPSGKESLLMLLEPPSWSGEISLFDGLPRTHDAIADGPSVVVHVPQRALETLVQEQPAYWFEFGRLMAQQLRVALLGMDENALLPVPVRLARRLLHIIQNYGDRHTHSSRVIGVSQEQLAMMLCISRQTTNQLLKNLEAQGAVRLRYGEIEIIDLEKLRELSTPPE